MTDNATSGNKISDINLEVVTRFRVAGVTFEGRQDAVRKMAVGDGVVLKREPTNEYDPNAIAVYSVDGHQLGYVPRTHTRRYVDDMGDLHTSVGTVVRVFDEPDLTAGLTVEVIL